MSRPIGFCKNIIAVSPNQPTVRPAKDVYSSTWEDALGVKFNRQGQIAGKRAVVRYADDFVVFCESKEDAEKVKDEVLPKWLTERGLALSSEKTRIVNLTEGFDFLGFNVRHYGSRTTTTGRKLLIKPSKKSVTNKRKELREIWLKMKGQKVSNLLYVLNPIIRGWANYYRSVVSSEVFKKMDRWMYYRAVRYTSYAHPNKSAAWKKQKYWGKLDTGRNDNWVFGDKQTGRCLLKFDWTKIVRHPLILGA